MIFATASRQSSYSSVIILALQREGSIFAMSGYINSAEFIDFNVIQENDALMLLFFTHNILKYSLTNFPIYEKSSTPKKRASYCSQGAQILPFGFITSVKS